MTDPLILEALRALLDRNRAELIAQYDAAGVGIGREGTEHVIVIYLLSEGHHPPAGATLEGVPLKFVVTGPFTNRN